LTLRALRNRFPSTVIRTWDVFQFVGPEVSHTIEPPLLAYNSFDLGNLSLAARTLEGYLDAFFTPSFAGASPESVSINVAVAFRYTDPDTHLALETPVLQAIGGRPHAGWIAGLAQGIADWETTNRPPFSVAAYTFQVQVFADEKLVIAIGKLFLDLARIG
jgi:hypothetical protein